MNQSILELGYQKLTMEDKGLFEEYSKRLHGMVGSYDTFEAIMAWDFYSVSYYKIIGDFFCVLLDDHAENRIVVLPPLGKYESKILSPVLEQLEEDFSELECDFIMVHVSDWMLSYLENTIIYDIDHKYLEDESDYIYKLEEFQKGLNKQSSRYSRNYFIRHCDPKVVTFDEVKLEELQGFLKETWCNYHPCEHCKYGCLDQVLSHFYQYHREYNLKTVVVLVDDKIKGYLAISIYGKTAVFQIKKNTREIRGVTEFLHAFALEHYCQGIEHINYTEDMGLEGLRKHKQKISATYELFRKYELFFTKRKH